MRNLPDDKNSTLGAVGLFTGVRGNGNGLSSSMLIKTWVLLKRKFGETLDGAPVVTSTRANAAKYIFKRPMRLCGGK